MIQAFRGDSGVTTEFSGAAEIDEGDCLTRISRVPGCCRSAKARDFIRLEPQRPSSGRQQGHIRSKKTVDARCQWHPAWLYKVSRLTVYRYDSAKTYPGRVNVLRRAMVTALLDRLHAVCSSRSCRQESSMRFCKFLLVGCLSLVSLVCHAETVKGLYQVREPVNGQSPEEREQATIRALDTLVLRLTGDPKAAQSPGLAAIRKDPQQIISQYGFEAGPPEVLKVDFDPGTTEQALRRAGLAMWGANRPSILGWWLNDSTEGSSLVGDGQASAVPLRRAAQHRGLPLRLPLADLNEQIVATAPNLEGTDPAPLQAASERYNADALLAVHAKEEGGQWQAKWQLWLGDKKEAGSVQGADQAAVADAVMLAVNERLAPRFVAKPGASSAQLLEVQGMNLEHYASLGRLLEPFGGRVQSVDGDRIVYRVNGSTDQLRAQLSLARLQETPAGQPPATPDQPAAPGAAPAPAPAPTPQLRFRW
jgi:hypothetical protein